MLLLDTIFLMIWPMLSHNVVWSLGDSKLALVSCQLLYIYVYISFAFPIATVLAAVFFDCELALSVNGVGCAKLTAGV
jgi:hypothetical protein